MAEIVIMDTYTYSYKDYVTTAFKVIGDNGGGNDGLSLKEQIALQRSLTTTAEKIHKVACFGNTR